MAENLPKYNASVPYQVVDQPDPTSSANELIGSFRNFTNAFGDVTDTVTKQAAEEQRSTLKNNISTSYKQFALQAIQNPNQTEALANYQKTSAQYAKQLMEQTNVLNRGYVSNLTDYYHNEHANAIERNAILQNKRTQQVDAYERMNQATMDWKDAITNSKPLIGPNGEDLQFEHAKALFAISNKEAKQNAINGLINASRVGDSFVESHKEFKTEMFLKRYQDHVVQGRGDEYIREVLDPNKNIEGFDEEDKTKLIGKMIHIRDQNRSAARVAYGDLNGQIHDEWLRVADGGTPNQELMYNAKMVGEETYNKLIEGVNVAQHVYSNKLAATYKSPEGVEQLKSQLSNIDPNDPDYGTKRRIADESIKAIDLQIKQFKENPLAVQLREPAIAQAVNTYHQAQSVDAAGYPMHDSPFNSIVKNPYPSIIQDQLHRGLTLNGTGNNSVRLLQPGQATDYINTLQQASPSDKIGIMNKLSTEFSDPLSFKLVMKQLVNNGLDPNMGILAGISSNSPDAPDVAEALSIPKSQLSHELNSKDKGAVQYINYTTLQHVYGIGNSTDSFESYINTTSSSDGLDNHDHYATVSNGVQQLAYYYSLTKNLSAPQAIKKAEEVIANRYEYATINNNEVRIPKEANITDQIVRDYAYKLEETQLRNFDFDMRGYDEYTAQAYKNNIIYNGHWKTDDVDHGLVWVDENGKMWTDKNGHPLSFDWEEAKTGIKRVPANPKAFDTIEEQQAIEQQTTRDLPYKLSTGNKKNDESLDELLKEFGGFK